MKTANKDQKTKQGKNPTTNYAKDSHKDFCKRCSAYNKGCPMTSSGVPDSNCSL